MASLETNTGAHSLRFEPVSGPRVDSFQDPRVSLSLVPGTSLCYLSENRVSLRILFIFYSEVI